MIRIALFSIAIAVGTLDLGVNMVRGGEEDLFRAAEDLYQRRQYPKAAETYRRLLASTSGRQRRQVLQRLYDIANYWLGDTWLLIKQSAALESPDWLVWVYPSDVFSDVLPEPRELVRQALCCRELLHWDDSKPLFNEEGRAADLLRCIHHSDPTGPFADKTLYLLGYLAWFHEDFHRADECFSRLEKEYPSSPYQPFAIELAIKSKLMVCDGSAADGPRLSEARRLIAKSQHLPQFSEEKKRDLMKLLASVYAGQSDLALQAAEKCHLAGRLKEARARYQRIRECFPGTGAAEEAAVRLTAIARAMQAE